MPNPASVFGGAATLNGNQNLIYQPGIASFGLDVNALAQVADGSKGLGLDTANSTYTFTFNNPLNQFGGYFNADSRGDTVTFTFRDAIGGLVGIRQVDVNPNDTTDGTLNFFGFTSATAFSSVSLSGNYGVSDSLRANLAPAVTAVPEPSEYAAMGMLGATLLFGMVKARRKKAAAAA